MITIESNTNKKHFEFRDLRRVSPVKFSHRRTGTLVLELDTKLLPSNSLGYFLKSTGTVVLQMLEL